MRGCEKRTIALEVGKTPVSFHFVPHLESEHNIHFAECET